MNIDDEERKSGQCIYSQHKRPLENLPAIMFRMMYVESDAKQETKVTAGHNSHMHNCGATSITHRLQMLVIAGTNG